MTKLKSLLYSCLLIVSIGFAKNMMAQTGSTCATALSLTISVGGSTNWETTANDTVWYNFVAPAPVCYFTFYSSLINKKVIKDVVYGVCGNFPNANTLYRVNDTTLYLAFSKLTISNNYKLGIVFGESGYCETCANIGVYKLGFTSVADVAATCTATCAGAPICNYLCNGDYEQIRATPIDEGDLYACNWTSANGATPDLFSTAAIATGVFSVSIPSNYIGCEGIRATGNNYAGFFSAPSFYEAIISPLSTNLTNAKTYQISFWLSQAESSIGNVNNIGFGFTNGYTAPTSNTLSTFGSIPSITSINTSGVSKTGWVNRTYTYTANGSENRFIVGAINSTILELQEKSGQKYVSIRPHFLGYYY